MMASGERSILRLYGLQNRDLLKNCLGLFIRKGEDKYFDFIPDCRVRVPGGILCAYCQKVFNAFQGDVLMQIGGEGSGS